MNKILKRSVEAYKKAIKVIPGGVDSPVRSFSGVHTDPVFIEKGKGSKLTDLDGNSYIDYVGSWGPLITGHSDPKVFKGIDKRLSEGITFGLPTEIETELATRISSAFPSIEQVRFVNSGTEAVMSAIRLARGVTGRDKIIKFEGGYHGHSDSMLVKAGSGVLTHGSPSSSGVTKATAKDTLVAEYNNTESVKRLLSENSEEIAAIIIEPVAGNMGVVTPDPGFLEEIRRLTEEEGVLLIFDEVITGFRTAYGGIQTLENIKPDITILGKIIGGGLPIGAFGADHEIMKHLSPEGEVYQAGTLSGNPLVMLLGINMLDYLRDNQNLYEELTEKAFFLERKILQAAEDSGLPVSVNRYGSMFSLFFTSVSPKSFADVQESNVRLYEKFFKGMLDRGILIPPSQFEGWFISTAHSKKDLNATVEAIREVFLEIGNER